MSKIHCLEFPKNGERRRELRNQTVRTWAEDMVQWIKSLLRKRKDPSSNPQHIESQGGHMCLVIQHCGRERPLAAPGSVRN